MTRIRRIFTDKAKRLNYITHIYHGDILRGKAAAYSVQLSAAGDVLLKVYDAMGREVQTLVREN